MAITLVECETKPLGFNTLWRAPAAKTGVNRAPSNAQPSIQIREASVISLLAVDLGSLWGLYRYLAVFAVLIIADAGEAHELPRALQYRRPQQMSRPITRYV